MRFPAINKQSKRRVNVPEFTGGINLRDNPVHCLDNQLTEMKNLYYADGALRTRPAFNREVFAFDVDGARAHNVFKDSGKGKSQLFSLEQAVSSEEKTKVTLNFYWFDGEKAELAYYTKKETVTVTDSEGNETTAEQETAVEQSLEFTIEGKEYSYFVIRHNAVLYCFIRGGLIYKLEEDKAWAEVKEAEYYVPHVVMQCRANGNMSMNSDEVMTSGVALEGYNLLSDYYEMSYNAYNDNIAEDVKDGNGKVTGRQHEMKYSLLEHTAKARYKGKKVSAKLTFGGTTYEHSVTLTGAPAWVWETTAKGDGLVMGVSAEKVWFRNGSKDGSIGYITDDNDTDDNLIITAPYISDNREEEKKKIFGMTRAEWFGGASAGLEGGTRLFLCGNSGDEKALVAWSGLNKPLYFPENSYFYVGDSSEGVTGFGKQSDMLVIFKESEVWFTQYRQNTGITADDLISQSVADITSGMAYFPLTQINGYIGCPYPDTVQLCRNRLVWLGKDKQVYTLISNNQYNERNIFAVSDMIKSRLKAEELTGRPCAADWEGYYCLGIGGHIYLMDYNSYGYAYITSYSKTEDAALRIPWYYWELDGENTVLAMFSVNDGLSVLQTDQSSFLFGVLDEEADRSGIKSVMQTKFFDFGEPAFYKNVSTVGLSLGSNDSEEITVTFITDGGECQESVILEDGAGKRTAAFTKSVMLTPGIYSSVRFGIRLESDGNMIIDGMTIDYRILGRAR